MTRAVALDFGQRDVRRHHGADAGVHRHPEGDQLAGGELGPALSHDRKRGVGVHVRVAMTGEVLDGGDHAGGLDASHGGAHQHGHPIRIGPERAGIDDRVVRVVVDVGHRREDQVDAHDPSFERGDPAHHERVLLPARRGHPHIGRERGSAHEAER